MEIYLIIITIIVSGALSMSRRNIQRQVDTLERRYENDYLSVKENLRDLWQNIDHLETVCSIGTEATTRPTPVTEKSPVQHKIAAFTPTIPAHVSQLVKGLSEEKEFLRKNLANLTDSVAKVHENCTSKLTEKMNYLAEVDTKCSKLETELELWHRKHSLLSDKVESMTSEIEGLQLVINQALEEVMQNSILNKPASCIDMAKSGVTSSGVYTLHYKMQPFTVYCLMDKAGGYTFISPETYINVDIETLSNDKSHVIIRHRRTNGLQYESRIEQISKYKSRPLSVQYNAHTGYTNVVNNKMTPYIYVGLNPIKLNNGRQHRGDRQGYESNGKEFTFVNCDGNPNGYFAFLFNHNNAAVSRKGESAAISRKWIESSTRVTGDIVPDRFLSFFELHFGGCGAYAGTNHIGTVTGAAVGIPYTL